MSQNKKRLSLFSFGSNSSGESKDHLSQSPTDLSPPGLERQLSGYSGTHPKKLSDNGAESLELKPTTSSPQSRKGSDVQGGVPSPTFVTRARSTSDISQRAPLCSPDSIFERLVQDCCTIDETCVLEQPTSGSPISSHSTGNSVNPVLGMTSTHSIHPPKCDRCRRSKSTNCNHHGSQVQLAGLYFMKSEDMIPPALDATTSIFSDKDTNLDQVEMIYSNRRNSSVISLNMALGRTPANPNSLGSQFPNSRKNSSYSLSALNTANVSPVSKALPINTNFANPFEYKQGNMESSPTTTSSTVGQGGFHSPLSPASFKNSTSINNNLLSNSISGSGGFNPTTTSYNAMTTGPPLSATSSGQQQQQQLPSSSSSTTFPTPPTLSTKPRRSLSFYSYADMINLEDHPASRKPLIKQSSLTFLNTQQSQNLSLQSPAYLTSLNYLTSNSPLTFTAGSSNYTAGPQSQLPPSAIPVSKHKMTSSQLSKVFRRKHKKPQNVDDSNGDKEDVQANNKSNIPSKLALPISPESSDSEDNIQELTELDVRVLPPKLAKRKSVSSQASSLWDTESLVLTSIGDCIRQTTSEINGL
ncbi:uncharacterized protein KQ657_004618 [Scheffersomyces spartinae]|uniref:Uncharacterized protein n=1 Tax=Scheffersomyces spartinae TaxID=45513 RepID=A0A9P7VAW5_9ASCO|nr:uncharacterized protein KQ657_004618 [Scheffersomyces spartinae]KAG7194405.1 hypothetical protein KQ657_004618 [Scheffersomyces spartinae]